jgi:F-type H+-transporting ATPase subunit delta
MAVAHDTAANRYAEAAFGIAREDGAFDRWRADLASIAELAEHPQAGPFLAAERVLEADKRRLLERALDISPLAMNVALMLLQRGRLPLAPQILAAYDRLLDEQRGIVNAEVTTAVPLDDGARQMVSERLRQLTGANEIRITTRIDPSLIGGMVARVGDRLIDGSTRTRLIQLKRALAGEAR